VPVVIAFVLLALSNFGFTKSDSDQQLQVSQKPTFTKTLNLDPKVTYENIIPAVDYDVKGYEGVGKQNSVANVANKCLFYFSHVRNATAWEYGVYTAEWLANHGTETGDYIAFQNNFTWPPYNITAGWKSAVAQSSASDCFLKTYSYTNDGLFLNLAKKSLMFLQVPIEQGGVLIDERDGKWWYEGYASTNVKAPQVLISHQSTLLSLANYLAIDNDTTVQKLFNNGLKALEADALLYKNGNNNSFFDRLGNQAGSSHSIHIANFQRLYDITKDEKLLEIKKTFEA
jgi:hypothetical protein